MVDKLFSQVRDIFVHHLMVEGPVTLSSRLIDDLSLDELEFNELLMTLEEEFDISIPEEAEASLVTVGNVVDLVRSLL